MAQKPVWSLDQVYDQLLRKGTLDPDEQYITFSFPLNRPSEYWRVGEDFDKTFTALTDQQIDWATRAIRLWEDVIDIKFIDKGHSGDAYIRFFNTYYEDDASASAYGPWADHHSGDVWIRAAKPENFIFGYGQESFDNVLHEIGHTLGLSHPGNYDASDDEDATYDNDAEYFQDSDQYTIMSYFGPWETGAYHGDAPSGTPVQGQTPMLHDIYVLQQRYGANLATRTGNTTYGFNSNAGNAVYDFVQNPEPALAIWDAGGIDTLDLSQGENDARIDLRPGSFTSALGGRSNIAIAYNCWIEKAKGGLGDDTITGNSLANTLRGGERHDLLYGFEGNDTLIGEDGRDSLFGATGNDIVSGGDSDDRLYGWTGDDEIDGGSAGDYVEGWTGDDTLTGGSGDDTLSGHTGVDQYDGGTGFDMASYEYSTTAWRVDLEPDNGAAPIAFANGTAEILYGIESAAMGGGNDTVYGSSGDNIITGANGNDRLYGYQGNDTLQGGAGDDRLYRDDGSQNLIEGGAGTDRADYGSTGYAIAVKLYQNSGQRVVDRPGTANDQTDRITGIENFTATGYDDTIAGSASANTIDGSNGDDSLTGWSNDDSLFGGYGDDTLEGGTGNDTLNGGIAIDIASYENHWTGVFVTTADGVHTISGAGSDRFFEIDGLIGSAHGDELGGDSGYNLLYGGAGNDELDGFGGSDRLVGDEGLDRLDGGSGDDTVWGQEGNDILTGGTGDDQIAGWDGQDTVDYSGSQSFVRVDLELSGPQDIGFTQGFDRFIDIEHAVGSSLGDKLRGTSATNKLYGLGGNDVLEGRGGNDILDGGMGSDTVSYESAAAGVTVNLANTLPQNTKAGIDSFISIENADGSAHADFLAGNFQDNYVRGLDGDDWLIGGDGDDWVGGYDGGDLIFADIGDDILSGGNGSDTASFMLATAGVTVSIATNAGQDLGVMGIDRLYFFEHLAGSAFDDSLTGNTYANRLEGFGGNDVIAASGGADTILAGGGSDTMSGGSGQDIMTGGAGSDVFGFTSSDSSASLALSDIVTDFTAAADRIDLAAIDADDVEAGHQPLSFIGAAAFSAAGQVRFAQDTEEDWTIVAVNLEGAGSAEMRIRLDGILSLSAGEFIL